MEYTGLIAIIFIIFIILTVFFTALEILAKNMRKRTRLQVRKNRSRLSHLRTQRKQLSNQHTFIDYPPDEVLPYHAKPIPMSKAELNFYRVLKHAINDNICIFPQMPLGSIFYAKTGDRNLNATYRNRINLKRVDFLLCDTETLKPIAAIELDDKSHLRPDRIARDNFVNTVFRQSQIPLIRIPASYDYSVNDLTERLRIAGVNLKSTSSYS